MKRNMRGVRPDRRGGGKWIAAISDPFHKRQRRFHFNSQDEAVARKLDTVAKIKAVEKGALTVPSNVEDIVLWIVKDGKEGFAKDAIESKPGSIQELISSYLERQRGRIVAPAGEGISLKQFQSDEYQLRLFRQFCEEGKTASVERAFHASTLERYKAHAANHFGSMKSLSHATATVNWQTCLLPGTASAADRLLL